MSTYTLNGDDIQLDGFWSGVKKIVKHSPFVQTVKFIAHPVKQTKAAVKTIARFDPTSKTAKYGNISRGYLAIGAAVGATILTAGAAGPGALALVGAALPGAKTMITPVRKPPKTIAPDPLKGSTATGNNLINSGGMPINSFSDSVTSDRPADTSITNQYGSGAGSSKKPVIGFGMALVATAIAVYALSIKKS